MILRLATRRKPTTLRSLMPDLSGDLVGRLTAALLAEPWTESPQSAHGVHRFYAGCALCCGDVDRLAPWIVRFMEPEALVAEVDAFNTQPDGDQDGELLADAYDLDAKAEALREAADDWEALGRPGDPSPIGVWFRDRADRLERDAGHLRDTVPAPASACQVIDVDGEPIRVQADADMPDEVRAGLEDVIRTVQRNHGRSGRTFSEQETVQPDQPLRDRIGEAIGDAWPVLRKDPVHLDQLAATVLPVAQAWAGEQIQRADQADKRAARAEAMVVLYRLQEDDPDSLVQRLDNAEAAVQRLERLRDKWLAFPADDMHHAAGDMFARWLDHDPERPEVRDA